MNQIGSVSKKVVALAFIVLVVLGNIWVMALFTHDDPPAWTATAFFGCIVVLALGAIGLGVGFLFGPKNEE